MVRLPCKSTNSRHEAPQSREFPLLMLDDDVCTTPASNATKNRSARDGQWRQCSLTGIGLLATCVLVDFDHFPPDLGGLIHKLD